MTHSWEGLLAMACVRSLISLTVDTAVHWTHKATSHKQTMNSRRMLHHYNRLLIKENLSPVKYLQPWWRWPLTRETRASRHMGATYFIPNVNYTILIVTIIEIKIEKIINCCKNKGHLYEKKKKETDRAAFDPALWLPLPLIILRNSRVWSEQWRLFRVRKHHFWKLARKKCNCMQ